MNMMKRSKVRFGQVSVSELRNAEVKLEDDLAKLVTEREKLMAMKRCSVLHEVSWYQTKHHNDYIIKNHSLGSKKISIGSFPNDTSYSWALWSGLVLFLDFPVALFTSIPCTHESVRIQYLLLAV